MPLVCPALWLACWPPAAGVDPPDQHAAPPPRPLGGHGVPAGQPEEAPHLDTAQATAAVAAADGRRRRRRAGRGPAAAANQWGSWLGSSRTHHIVLLDDSFSMSDRWADTSALGRPRRWSSASAPRPPARSTRRTSRCCDFPGRPRGPRHASPTAQGDGRQPTFAGRLRETLGQDRLSQTAAGPRRSRGGRSANCWAKAKTSTASSTWSPTSALRQWERSRRLAAAIAPAQPLARRHCN